MSKFEEITVTDMRIVRENGECFILGKVDFSYASTGPKISVELSVVADETQNLEMLEKALAEEAISLLREVSALPDETVSERIRRGTRSFDESGGELIDNIAESLGLGNKTWRVRS